MLKKLKEGFVIKVPSIFLFWLRGPSKGMAIWPFIFVTMPDDLKLVYHERVHIRQQLKGFLIVFYVKYLYYQLRYGYRDNPYEVEARKLADEWWEKEKLKRRR